MIEAEVGIDFRLNRLIPAHNNARFIDIKQRKLTAPAQQSLLKGKVLVYVMTVAYNYLHCVVVICPAHMLRIPARVLTYI